MNQNDYFIHVSKLCNTKRVVVDESCIAKRNNELHITYCENDCLDKFEEDLNLLAGSSSSFYNLKKRFSTGIISMISVFVILMGLFSNIE